MYVPIKREKWRSSSSCILQTDFKFIYGRNRMEGTSDSYKVICRLLALSIKLWQYQAALCTFRVYGLHANLMRISPELGNIIVRSKAPVGHSIICCKCFIFKGSCFATFDSFTQYPPLRLPDGCSSAKKVEHNVEFLKHLLWWISLDSAKREFSWK